MKHLRFFYPNSPSTSCRMPCLLTAPMVMVAVASLSACSTGAWYEGMKISEQRDCERQAPGAREDCLSRLNTRSHDTYEKERAPLTP
jgi:hypothetical protein